MVKLLGYDLEIQYRAGYTNRAADALSQSGSIECSLMTTTAWLDWDVCFRELRGDPFLSKIVDDLDHGVQVAGFTLEHGRLMYHGRVVLFATSSLIPQFLTEYHCSPVGGHSGELRTYHRLKGDVYWVGMKAQVVAFVQAFDICQRKKTTPVP